MVVVTSIVPPVHLLDAFDRVTLLRKGGDVVYFGPSGPMGATIMVSSLPLPQLALGWRFSQAQKEVDAAARLRMGLFPSSDGGCWCCSKAQSRGRWACCLRAKNSEDRVGQEASREKPRLMFSTLMYRTLCYALWSTQYWIQYSVAVVAVVAGVGVVAVAGTLVSARPPPLQCPAPTFPPCCPRHAGVL